MPKQPKKHCERYRPKRQETPDDRPSAAKRGYDSSWKKVRKLKLNRDPLCEQCAKDGVTKAANVVHHIKPLGEGGKRLDENNLMSLCRNCHEILEGRKNG